MSVEHADNEGIKSPDLAERPPVTAIQSFVMLTADEDRFYIYTTTVVMSAVVGLTHTLLGAVILSVVLFSIVKEKSLTMESKTTDTAHAALFTIAYHFFAAEGILGLSLINGWSTPMRKTHRQYAHIFLLTCTILFAVIGVMQISIPKIAGSRSFHGLSGLATLVLTGTAWVVGPFLMKWEIGIFNLRKIRPAYIAHKISGLLCFVMSSVCLCSGLVSEEFCRWAGKKVVSILWGFVIFNTFVAICTSYMKYETT